MHHTTWTRGNGIELTASGRLLQSGDGYLWFMARSILVRFDGVRFTRIDSLTSPLLQVDSGAVARPLLVDRHGVMWLVRSDGALLNYRDGVFSIAVPPNPKRRRAATGFEDRAGQIWIEIAGSVFRVEGGRIVKPLLPAGVPMSGLTGVVRDSGTGIWIGSRSQGLWHVTGNHAERVDEPPNRSQGTLPAYQSANGQLWVWGPQALMVLREGKWSPVLFNNNTIAPSDLLEGAGGEMWVGTQDAGMLRIDSGRIEQFSKRHGLTDVSVRDAMYDREGNLWVLTSSGIERFRSTAFTTLGASDNVPFEQATQVLSDGDRGLWVESTDARVHHASGGIISADTNEIRWTPFRANSQPAAAPVLLGQGGGTYLWRSGVGIEYSRSGHASQLVTFKDLDAVTVRAVFEDVHGSLWMGFIARGNTPGLARWSNGALKHVALEHVGKPGNVSAIAGDSAGALWMNNTAGPIIYKVRGDSVVARIDSTDGVPAVVTVITVQGVDTLWMLTNRSSLVRVIGRKATRVHFANENPVLIPAWSTMVLRGRSLWIASSTGIVRLELAELHAVADGRGLVAPSRMYGDADGLPQARTTLTATGVAAIGRDGRMWLSTSGGLAVYDERFDRPNPVAPNVHVEEVAVDGKIVRGAIPPHPDRVDIHLTAISMRAPSQSRIEYMLENVDHDWISATEDRVATYTQLRAGHYRFHVRAWNEDGVPAVSQGLLAFRVMPTWYETALFRAVAILALLAAGPFVVYWVLQQRVRRREADLRARFDATLDERTRIARELHDTLLQGFSGITLQLHTVAHSLTKAPEKTGERLGRILKLADHTLADARQMIWDLRAPELEYQELSTALALAAREAIVDAPINLTFNVSGEARRLPPLVEATALRVGREAAMNAVRHARPSHIEIELAYSDTGLNLRVRDDGAGFREASGNDRSSSGHWGIKGMRERAVRAGGAVDISSNTGAGTTVSLLLPISGS